MAEEMVLGKRTQGERHLENKGKRRTLARKSVLLSMSMAIMLYSVHNGIVGEGSNMHQQHR